MSDRVGQQFGNYRLIRLLGRGGFAEVYLAEHLHLMTQAAVKVLHTSLEDDHVEGFLREAQTVARLRHPHIVRVFDFDIENHTPFLVMDYLPKGNVRRSYPKGTPLPLPTIISYVQQVASALQYAHDERLIHRDIKPENMLLDTGDTIVLSDFGIAVMAQSSRYQSTREVAGTASYMAPEQLQGKPRRASDQYALGVVVYEWLSGDRPFHGSFSEIASQHVLVPPPSLRERIPTLSPEIERVALTALEKDPSQRFATVQAFAHALAQASEQTESPSRIDASDTLPVTPPPRPRTAALSSGPSRQPASQGNPHKKSQGLTKKTAPGNRVQDPHPLAHREALPGTVPAQRGLPSRTPSRSVKETSLAGRMHVSLQMILSLVLLGLSLLLFGGLTILSRIPILGKLGSFFTLFFGWGAYVLALGLMLFAIARLVQALRKARIVRWPLVIGLLIMLLLLLAESDLLTRRAETAGLIGSWLARPLMGWPAAAPHLLLMGIFTIVAIMTYRVTFRD